MKFLNRIREKYNLQEVFEYEIKANKEAFLEKFNYLIKHDNSYRVHSALDLFVASHKKYIGKIDQNKIKFRQKKELSNLTISTYLAEIKINEVGSNLKIKTFIIAPETFSFILRIIFLSILSVIGITILIESVLNQYFQTIFFILFIFVAFVYLPYRVSISKIRRVKNELITIFNEIETGK